MSELTINDWASSRPAWPGLAAKAKEELRASFTRPACPEWVKRVQAALDYVETLSWQHSMGEHADSVCGPHPECPGCELTLTPEELVREHQGR